MKLLSEEPQEREEIQRHIDVLSTGIVSLSAIEDLGSSEANRMAMDNLYAIFRRWDELQAKLNHTGSSPPKGSSPPNASAGNGCHLTAARR